MLQTIDPTLPTYSAEQQFVAYVSVALILAASAVALYRLRYSGLDDDARSVKARVEAQLARQTPGTVRIESDPRDRQADIRAAFDAAGAVDETTTVRAAGSAVLDAALETYRPLAERVPQTARRLLGLAVLVLVVGSFATASESIIAALQADSSLDPIGTWPGAALRDSQAIFARLAGLPGLGLIGALLFAYAVLLAQWAFTHWWVLVVGLGLAAARLIQLRDVVADREPADLPRPQRVALVGVVAVGGAWDAALLASGLGRTTADKMLGRRWGFYAALVVGAVALGYLAYRVGRGAAAIARAVATADEDELGVVLTRAVGIGIAAIAAPLVPIWTGLALTNLPALVSAWLDASLATKIGTGLLAAGVVGAVAWVVRDAAADVRAALDETLTRKSVRVALGARAMPLGVIIGVYLLGAGLGVPVWVGLLGALVVGLVARGLWALAQRLRYRAQARPDPDPGVDRVVVHAYRLETPAGDQWWARPNGDAVAHPDRDAAVDAVITAAQDWLADGQQHPSLASAHAERLREDGVAEIEETKTRVRSAVRREAEGRVRQEGMLNREDLEAELAERYPESIWRREFARLRSRGPLVERDGYVFAN